ncbi:hypothetical protein ACH347_04855 [Saccharopolyspora sp. 5N102]
MHGVDRFREVLGSVEFQIRQQFFVQANSGGSVLEGVLVGFLQH